MQRPIAGLQSIRVNLERFCADTDNPTATVFFKAELFD
jgi:hypothetical protein